MSRLIDVDKALEVVRVCCREMVPQAKVVEAIDNAIKILSPAKEAGPLPRPAIPWGELFGLWLGMQRKPVDPLKLPVIPGRGIGPSNKAVEDLQQARAEALKTDFCSILLGCVSRGFRDLMLPQGQSGPGDRIRYVDYDWLKHLIPDPPQRIPKRRQRMVRSER